MTSLNIRDVDPAFVKRLKREALEADMSLKQYVLMKLGVPEGGEPRRAASSGTDSSTGRIGEGSDTRRMGLDHVPSAEMPTPPKPKKSKTCPHGIEKGFHCWHCQGAAKIEAAIKLATDTDQE